MTNTPTVAVLPEAGLEVMREAVSSAGAVATDDPTEADALVWCDARAEALAAVLADAPHLRWVQLPFAGIEGFLGVIDTNRTWTCAKDIYGRDVAELALGLLIAGMRNIHRYVRASSWKPLDEKSLEGSSVVILGAGGIGASLTRLLLPLGPKVTVVSRTGRPIEGATALARKQAAASIAGADAIVLAVPLTDETRGWVDVRFLSSMKPTAWLVNVARGSVVVTADLVAALERNEIGGAALDVTDPEPLPDGHPLWGMDNVIITPHVANTVFLGVPRFISLVESNVRRFAAGEPLLGLVDPAAGY